ncbi:MAG TPA: hypothetical protein IAA48_08985 [Candidatus Eubacterium faecipullorum]|uniref:Uncharacterized protein n=1 Tax=Candidatus Eubacterium faecipullorum TaxID=2838571 RepID=A0A9D1REF5_9FIRM|nr:hypothetical protein [Candidatus Eubacterium faecipullorum]
MRDLKRNQSEIWYSLAVPDGGTDKNGNKVLTYEEPVAGRFSLSTNKGEASMEAFGRNVDYDREMTTHDMKCPINEHTRIWIGTDKDKPYNYIVSKVAPSLNCIRYALKQVTTS